MQRPDQAKRDEILQAAAKLFASRPFHEVKLDDVATDAKVGKGTLYTYFTSKEALFIAIVDEAFARLVAELTSSLEQRATSAWDGLRVIVTELVRFGRTYPDKFRLMRSGVDVCSAQNVEARLQLLRVISGVLHEGVRRGELRDPHPELSAGYVLSSVRGALLYGPTTHPEDTVVEHILQILGHGMLPDRGESRP